MRQITILSTLLVLLCFAPGKAQEFIFDVEVNAPTLQTTDPRLFDDLESTLNDFLNNRRWTNEIYEEHERIKCNLILTISSELSSSAFSADLTIQAIRPVFGSNYETSLLNHVDKEFTFQFDQSTPVEYSDNLYTSNLTSVLAFYAYYILGLDHDSFSLYGGDRFFQLANEIINILPPEFATDSKSGWSSQANGRNRYFMIENILSPRTRPFRKAMYTYHRMGLDMMHQDPTAGKASMVEALKEMEGVSKSYPNSMIIQMFANAKAQEVTEVFAVADRTEKNEVYRIMTTIDPSNRNKYTPIRR